MAIHTRSSGKLFILSVMAQAECFAVPALLLLLYLAMLPSQYVVINRPGVAGAVIQSAPSLIQ